MASTNLAVATKTKKTIDTGETPVAVNQCYNPIEELKPPPKKPENPWWKACLNALIRYYRAKRQRWIDRAVFRHLMKLDDNQLADIGITRADVIWASKQPTSVCASQQLEDIARSRQKHL